MDQNQISVEVYSKKAENSAHRQLLKVVEKAGTLTNEEMTKLVSEIPNFSEVVRTTFAGVRYTYDETIKRNDKVVSNVMDACHKKMDALDRMLENESLSTEDRLKVVNEMSDVINTMEKIDRKNKHFIEESKTNSNSIIMGTLGITATVVLTVIAMLSGRKK